MWFSDEVFGMRCSHVVIQFERCVTRIGAREYASSANDGQVYQWVVDLNMVSLSM